MASQVFSQSTKAHKKCVELKWDIEDFSKFFRKDYVGKDSERVSFAPTVQSESFRFKMSLQSSETSYNLGEVWTTLKLKLNDEMLELHQSLSVENARSVLLTGTMELEDRGEEPCFVEYFLGSRQLNMSTYNYGYSSVVPFEANLFKLGELWDRKEKYFADDILRIRVKLEFYVGETIDNCNDEQSDNKAKEKAMDNLNAAFAKLRTSAETADVKFVCKSDSSVSFFAHKAVLTSRSRLFDRMFAADMKESKTKVLIIEDQYCEVSVFSALLDFIYTAKMPSDGEDLDTLCGLAMAADKYELIDLKMYCLSQLTRKLSCKNFGQVAMIFHLCSHDKKDQQLIWDFCSKNWLDLRHDPEVVQLTRDHPDAFFPPSPPAAQEKQGV